MMMHDLNNKLQLLIYNVEERVIDEMLLLLVLLIRGLLVINDFNEIMLFIVQFIDELLLLVQLQLLFIV